ncbi:MAG: FHA domain-containing protein [Deltaproteobacteria bacterium]|nr:FHA domain-containing protein [Deltaproteobacteria bacterium]
MIACKNCGAVNREAASICCRCRGLLSSRLARDTIVEVKPVAVPQDAEGAKLASDDSKAAVLTLSRGRALVANYRFSSPIISIGRDVDQDIVIDNASVSREHCRIRREGGHFVIHDLGTPNGTTVNGRAAVLQRLNTTDEIAIGEFVLIFQASTEQLAGLEYTIHPKGQAEELRHADTLHLDQGQIDRIRQGVTTERTAHLRVIGNYGGRPGKRFALLEQEVIIGRAIDADVPLVEFFIKPWHALLTRNGDQRFTIKHVAGLRRVYVNGKRVREARLKNRDLIRIGKAQFQFFDAL